MDAASGSKEISSIGKKPAHARFSSYLLVFYFTRDITPSKFNTYQTEENIMTIMLNIIVASVCCMKLLLYHSFETSTPGGSSNLIIVEDISVKVYENRQVLRPTTGLLLLEMLQEVLKIRAGLLDI